MQIMAAYKKVRTLTDSECAYIAGIIDGEGSVTLSTKQKGGTRHLAVSVSNTDLTLLKYLKKIVGAGKITAKQQYEKHHTPAYCYVVYSRQALDLLEQALPYLRTYKMQRAKLALQRYILVTPRNGKYNDDLRRKREKFVERFFSFSP